LRTDLRLPKHLEFEVPVRKPKQKICDSQKHENADHDRKDISELFICLLLQGLTLFVVKDETQLGYVCLGLEPPEACQDFTFIKIPMHTFSFFGWTNL
jgi:hypothetical protein